MPIVIGMLSGVCMILILVLLKLKSGFFKPEEFYFEESEESEAKIGEDLIDKDLENLINDVFNDVPNK